MRRIIATQLLALSLLPLAACNGGTEDGLQQGSGGSGSGGSARPDAMAGSGGSVDAGARDGQSDARDGATEARDGGGTGGLPGSGGITGSGGKTGSGGVAGSGGKAGSGGVAGSGGATCDVSAPPSNVAAWVDASWNDQLGTNVKQRKAWLLDNVMKGKGQLNLCVRWGASSAPSAAVKSGMAAAASRWFNDWFKAIGTYDCFPYGTGQVVTKVTGWAVKPGKEAWVSDLGPDVKIYTELDGSGEPKCPDACSFFVNWDHSFPSCPGGEAFHTDYWLWLDDTIADGAAAVGGDWGLRMPVSDFVAALGGGGTADQLNTIEHEMGHGFGFQDYYDWTGPRPTGGSIMIVGSTFSGTPTTADSWLARRTWKEMKTLRGW